MASLRRTVANIRTREGFPLPGVVSIRQLLTKSSLTPALSIRALIASDLIGERYQQDGRSAGPIGFPMGKVRLTSFGALQPFSGGFMVVRDKKADPVVAHQAQVRFLGFRCNEESSNDGLSPHDEPYFIIGVTGLSTTTRRFGPFEGVDAGESRFTADDGVIIRDVQPPFTISVVAMENDDGSPDEAAAKAQKTCLDALQVTQAVALTFGQVQVVAATVMLDELFLKVGGVLSGVVSDIFGLGDDFVGSSNRSIGDYNDGADEWRTPDRLIEDPSFSPDPYNVKIDVGDKGGGEGQYSLYFNVNMFEVTKVPV